MSTEPTFLVTGALGCIGAWTLHHLLAAGRRVVGLDIGYNTHRLDLLLAPEEKARITFVRGDITDPEQVLAALEAHAVTHVIHLAALQVPFCKADPVGGARVNVVGTVNVFEAARRTGVPHVAFASSIAVYGPNEVYPVQPVPHDAPHDARTLYGVYKIADEGIARLYAADYGVTSTGLRPYTVYGVGRDQGLTSEPSKALLAVAAGQPYAISFGGVMQFQLASDVARQFILAAEQAHDGSRVFNLGTPATSVDAFAETIHHVRPGAQVSVADTRLPFPNSFDDAALRDHATTVYETPLEEGIRASVQHFERLLAAGRIQPA